MPKRLKLKVNTRRFMDEVYKEAKREPGKRTELSALGQFNLKLEHQDFLEVLQRKKHHESQLKIAEEEIKEKENQYLQMMKGGKVFEWCWKYEIKRTNISWKDIAIQALGEKKVKEIEAKTPETIYPHVGVMGFHNEPEVKEPPKFSKKFLLTKSK